MLKKSNKNFKNSIDIRNTEALGLQRILLAMLFSLTLAFIQYHYPLDLDKFLANPENFAQTFFLFWSNVFMDCYEKNPDIFNLFFFFLSVWILQIVFDPDNKE